ncbi:hypothetical protein CJ255_22175 [Candidatus Viridilinea mediisalina]|uniref:Transposase (putative) YhgA-like domain-containing protein n=1 Tax=Candidatus Viridilinea mediisalina TaxID=2024553 RepID=A0A2A6RD97_9CHLR|nr:hypothetical protein CJ255_22175 [Candidatus Viridilinea mediisalina]
MLNGASHRSRRKACRIAAMTDLTNPHDKFFKATFSQPGAVARFLREFLPAEVTALFDLAHIQPVKEKNTSPICSLQYPCTGLTRMPLSVSSLSIRAR